MALPTPMQFAQFLMPMVDTTTGRLMIGARGDYVFTKSIQAALNGRGEAVEAGYSSAVWSWDAVPSAEYVFLASVLCLGHASQRWTTVKLYDDVGVLNTYTSCVLRYPTYDGRNGDDYLNVVLKIERIRASG